MPEFIDSSIDFLDKIRSDKKEVLVKFKKSDGTLRVMRCTLNFDNIPKENVPKSYDLPKILRLLQNQKMIHVFDLDKRDWRSISIGTTEWLQTSDGKRFFIKI